MSGAGVGLPAMALLVLASSAVAAPRNTDPDWPCQQAKVSELSVASYWSGPAIEASAADWQQNASVRSLVGLITQRRMPLEQAADQIAAFARSAGANRNRALMALFAGVFDVLDRERTKVVNGLDRFGQRQKTLAENLRRDGEELHAAQAATPADEAKVAELTQHLAWDAQLFEVASPIRALCLRRGDDD